MTTLLIPLAGMVLGGVIAVSAMYFHHHQKQMLHETARLALEKGQPLSPAVMESLSKSSHASAPSGARNDIRTGLILMAVGAGLFFFFSGAFRNIGAIPGLIGVALFSYGLLEPLFSRKSPRDDRSPQP